MRVSTTFGDALPESNADSVNSSSPFRILVLADLGGATVLGHPVTVDRDNLEDVMKQMKAGLSLCEAPALANTRISFTELEDFHPDRLFERLDVFESLRTRRQRLQNDVTFAAEAKAILETQGATGETEPQTTGTIPEPPAETIDPESLLRATLEQTQAAQTPIAQQIVEGRLDIDALARRLVEPYVLRKSDPRKPEFMAAVDDAIAETMRMLLHHPAYQNLEAAWLGIKMLVRRLETDRTLQISIVNVSKEQLRSDVCADDDLTKSMLYKMLVESTRVAGAEPWTAVVGDFSFDAGSSDTEVLGRVARIHSAAGAVFIAGASPGIVGCSDLAQTPDPDDWDAVSPEDAERWQELRSLSASSSVRLALPRILARRPYGQDTNPIDSFHFEEISDGRAHADYLWMNAAFAVTALMGQSFRRTGWSFLSAWEPGLENLPMHVYEKDGESVIKPCGEVELLLRAGNVFAEFGLTAVHSVREHDSVRIPSLSPLSRTHA